MSERSFVRSRLLTCPHGFSTRRGGVSEGVYESLNLGRLDQGDDPARVAENWRIFGEACGIDTSRFVHGKQVHGSLVRIAGPEMAHSILEPSGQDGADGYVTSVPGLPLAVFTADCTPLLMQEPEAGVVAAIHCGWRSTRCFSLWFFFIPTGSMNHNAKQVHKTNQNNQETEHNTHTQQSQNNTLVKHFSYCHSSSKENNTER